MKINSKRIIWEYKIFPDNSEPRGRLPKDLGAQACWWNFIRLHKIYKTSGTVEEQIALASLLEEDAWRCKRYLEVKRATGIIYSLDPAYVDKFWPYVIEEAKRLGDERFLETGEPFEMPETEYMTAQPGKVFDGHAENQQ